MEHEEHLKLLRATAEGQQEAFSELYQATASQLFAVSFKMLKHKELAEEAVQEAFVRIWHNASEYQTGKGTVLTWMISIVRYRVLDLIRYRKVRNEQCLEDQQQGTEEVSAQTASSDPFTDMNNDAEPQKLDRCMDELDSEQKQALHFAYFNGLSHQEVSSSMDSPLGSVKSWIRRGLQSLQRCLVR